MFPCGYKRSQSKVFLSILLAGHIMDNVGTVGKTTSSRPASPIELSASDSSMRGDPDAIAAHLLQVNNTPKEMKSDKNLLDLPPIIVQNTIANYLNYNDYVRFDEALQHTAIALPTITEMNECLNEGS